MGKVGNTLLKGITQEEINKELVALYAQETINAYASKVALIKVSGKAELLIKSRIEFLKSSFGGFADKIESRIIAMGGQIPDKLSDYENLSATELSFFPEPNNISEFFAAVLERFRVLIPIYASVMESVKDKDPFTYFMLLPILEFYVDHEEELENGEGIIQ
ncbi:hypothetical protein [Saccharicrinis aurantiacus]|uniref:hypothetical protein n=1 Tax=Saccharicrinis aurantiacus TaxID=1849719 RepID=UPI000839A4AB|nr:hypothetical protein [Saccharicrinis aurantiacus]